MPYFVQSMDLSAFTLLRHRPISAHSTPSSTAKPCAANAREGSSPRRRSTCASSTTQNGCSSESTDPASS